MAQHPPDGKFSNLGLRVITAAVLAPPVFAALYFGSPWFDLVILAAAGAMMWELTRICRAGRFGKSGWLLETGLFAVIAATYLGEALFAVCVVAALAALSGIVSYTRARAATYWLAAGVLLIGTFAVSFMSIRAAPQSGLILMIWLVCAVWFTDIGAYFAGKFIGGPKLAPRISPKKTWAGLVGGIAAATIWSVVWLTWGTEASIVTALVAGVVTALLAQLGDLSVSLLKRRFDVKDASGLLPGHGGVLDRIDGMLLVAPVAAVVLLFSDKGWI